MLEIDIKIYLKITHIFSSAMWHLPREIFDLKIESFNKIENWKKIENRWLQRRKHLNEELISKILLKPLFQEAAFPQPEVTVCPLSFSHLFKKFLFQLLFSWCFHCSPLVHVNLETGKCWLLLLMEVFSKDAFLPPQNWIWPPSSTLSYHFAPSLADTLSFHHLLIFLLPPLDLNLLSIRTVISTA